MTCRDCALFDLDACKDAVARMERAHTRMRGPR